jgi:carboxyl-terminal processing protease
VVSGSKVRSRRWLASRLIRICVLAVVCSAAAQQALTPEDRRLFVDAFEHVWKTVRDKHWDPKLGGLDWQAVHEELRPKVEAARTADEARAAMSAMLARLKQSHFGILPGDVYSALDDSGAIRGAGPGFEIRVIDGHALVAAVEPGTPAAARGVKPGWELIRANQAEIAPVIRRITGQYQDSTLLQLRLARAVTSRVEGPPGSPVHLEFLDGAGQTVALDIDRAEPRGKIVKFGNLPPAYVWTESRKVRPDVAYVRFNIFLDAEGLLKTIEDAVTSCRNCRGFVIDLRGNPGGVGGLAMGIAGWFVDHAGLQLGTEYLRSATIKFVIFPRLEPFRGPLAILVDGCSASTSEIFAGGLKDIRRARIFGTRTAGAALPSIIERLPTGDGFQYAIANYVSANGKPLEGIGVIPDVEVPLTRQKLLAGEDPVLRAALDWIEAEKEVRTR